MEAKRYYDTSKITGDGLGQAIDEMMQTVESARKKHSRRWYDNNFFDDGLHFRYLSRSQNKIIDLSERSSIYEPMRAIPKASRQLRGVINLLMSNDFVPVVYPEKVIRENFGSEEEYAAVKDLAKNVSKRSGHWIEEEFKDQDIKNKLSFMGILTGKHGISYLQITPDAESRAIKTIVRDAFDVYLMGEMNEVEECPFVIIGHPEVVSKIKSNEEFTAEQREKINPDNKQASSEIKDAYMRARYGGDFKGDSSATVILKEAYLKERLNPENRRKIEQQENAKDILGDRKDGDVVVRQVFSAGNIWLRDEYLELPHYPLVDLRFEPGALYQVPLIERFIPSNKSLDAVVSRIERYTHTMVVGTWIKRQGEQFNVSNQSGGQVVEYKGVPPTQGQVANLPSFIFNYINLLNSFIEEQGVSTAALAQIPSGVKAAKAIESLKESEYANLVIPNKMLKKAVQTIAQRFLDLADRYFIDPKTVQYLEKGEPQYFDIMSKSAINKRKQLNVPVGGDVVPVSKDYKVEVEVQSGMGYTREGKKAAAKELGDYLIQLSTAGLIPPQAITKFLEVMLEAYQFGPTGDFISTMEKFMGEASLTEQQLQAIKVAIAEVMKDVGVVTKDDLPTPEDRITEDKIATAQAIKDTGIADENKESQKKEPSKNISFKDLPPTGKEQLARQAGIEINVDEVKEQEQKVVKGGVEK